MRKVWLSFSLLLVCGNIFAQTSNNPDYPNTEPFMRFWQKLRTDVSNGKVELNKNYEIKIQANFHDKKISKGDLKFEINENSPEMLELLRDFLLAVDDSKLLKVITLESLDEKIEAAVLRIKFDAVNADLRLSLKTNSDKTARKVASRFSLLFGLTARLVTGRVEEEFYKNAVVSAEGTEIFVNGKISRQNLVSYIKDGFMSAEKKVNECQIIREIQIPLTKKPNVKTETKVALLNICLNDTILQQRPVIEVLRNGEQEFRTFEVLKVFNDQAEAEKYAQDNGISDVAFSSSPVTR